ncbi:uroporphyrinogen-III C-methyltransferase [Agarivorans sp. QJM3NY_33]|uniref:uroporphyrinogen-III C-methyltransferase n=1 Tax=Agarivorans sp. QJM3NY_33 TaxID=3421432 RepID=UPI003D7C669D
MSKGKVYLIGAGPGDPGLLTCRAKQLLSDCDVVCYDKLVSAAILSVVPAHVQLYQVGYRGYQGCHIDYGMHPDVLAFAHSGKRVARLKAGDPCIFGRMTEECRDLEAHQIDYELVPGITAALGAAAYSGFPLTSGGIASSVTFVSGHKSSDSIASWGALGQDGGTLVLYMGAKQLAKHVQNFIRQGRSPETPIALIFSATSADHHCVVATLASIADKVAGLQQAGPALVIVGEVVAQAKEFDWCARLPLFGLRVLLCGYYPQQQAISELGAEVIQVDSLPCESSIHAEDWRFFANQVELGFADLSSFKLWWQSLKQQQRDIRQFRMPMGSDDPAVCRALEALGIAPAVLSEHALILTLDALERDPNSRYHNIGQRLSQALAYPLPSVDWLLVEDSAIAASLYKHHAEALQGAKLIALNERVRDWATQQGHVLGEAEALSLFDLPEALVYEAADVA